MEDDDPQALDGTKIEEGFKYVVGYIQRKTVKKFPKLHLPMGDISEGSWISAVSRGHLISPCDRIVKICKKLEAEFNIFHGDNIDMEPNPMERLLDQALRKRENNEIDNYIVSLYLRFRFFKRLKYLNIKDMYAASAEKIRKNIQTMQHLY